MRRTFIKTLAELAERDPRIVLLTADLGYMAIEPFSERWPDRFFNVGVAEQNMMGMATGLAESGYMPFVYSIVTFAALRPFEFIRNGPILHQLPVRIVAVGGGLEYGSGGPTHHGLEDIGVMRTQPGISIIAPADHQQAGAALLASWNMPGPVYYRLGKDDRETVPGLEGRFELGRAQLVRRGADLLFISMGSITNEVTAAAGILADQGFDCAVLVVASINPAPVDELVKILSRYHTILTVESHYLAGGIGSLISEIVAGSAIDCRVVRCGVARTTGGKSGSQRYLRRYHGLDSKTLAMTALRHLHIQGGCHV